MADEKVKGVSSTTQSRVVQKEARERDFSSKKKKQRNSKDANTSDDNKFKEEHMEKHNYVDEVKTALMYGDVGHGVLLDKKV